MALVLGKQCFTLKPSKFGKKQNVCQQFIQKRNEANIISSRLKMFKKKWRNLSFMQLLGGPGKHGHAVGPAVVFQTTTTHKKHATYMYIKNKMHVKKDKSIAELEQHEIIVSWLYYWTEHLFFALPHYRCLSLNACEVSFFPPSIIPSFQSALRFFFFSFFSPQKHTGPRRLPAHHQQRQSVAVTRSRTVTNDTRSQSSTYHRTSNTQAWKWLTWNGNVSHSVGPGAEVKY